jgi:hypothetical protein
MTGADMDASPQAAPGCRTRRTIVDIVFLAVAVIAALLLARQRALVVTLSAWALCVAMVGWGPANNANVHTQSVGFWLPWIIVLGIGSALAYGIGLLKQRRAARP